MKIREQINLHCCNFKLLFFEFQIKFQSFKLLLSFWPINSSNNFTIKKYLFGAVELTRNAISLFTVVMAFGGARTRCFSNLFAQNAVIFGVDISPARHSENPKNIF